MSDPSPKMSRWVVMRTAAIVALCVVCLFVPKAAPAAIVLALIGFLSLPDADRHQARIAKIALGLGAVAATAGYVRFIAIEGMPGIVAGGQRATRRDAVSALREILIAQDAMRRYAHHDPDGDGVGSAALLTELTGAAPLRGDKRLQPPVLNPRRFREIVETRVGPAAAVGGYLIVICLPANGGTWTARPGEAVDDERAERRFVAYAWPRSNEAGVESAYSIDEHDRILRRPPSTDGPKLVAPGGAPRCESTTVDPRWRAWRGKKPRSALLPGDRGARRAD